MATEAQHYYHLFSLDNRLTINKDVIDSPNLCDRFSSDDLTKIGDLVWEGYVRDEASRARWKKRMEAALDLAMQVQKDKNFPWPGCSNVTFPLVTISSLQFSARSYSNIIQGSQIVNYQLPGGDLQGSLRETANRIGDHMSWQCLSEDRAWEEQHDRLLINLAIVGTNFVKTYYSSQAGCIVSELVMARDLVMDYFAKSVEECARKTQVLSKYRNEIYEKVYRGIYRKSLLNEEWYCTTPTPLILPDSAPQQNRQGVTPPATDEDSPFVFLEQHRYLDLDCDGYAEPYIVTIEAGSKKPVRIVTRFEDATAVERAQDRSNGRIISIRPTEYYTKYSFIPAADGGIYDTGFGVLLGPLNESVNSGINQLLDSGTMQNSIGGFLGRGAKIRGGVYTMAPWEWKRVDSTGDDLRKSMVPYPERQPSTVMFQLLGLLIQYCDRLAGTTDVMTGGNPGQNTPAYNMREMVNQGMQVYNVIFKRIWRSMKEEFKKRHQLNYVYLPQKTVFGVDAEGKDRYILREDYRLSSDKVVPMADPNLASNGERFSQAQAIRQASRESPGYNIPEVERNFLRAMRVDGIDRFYDPQRNPPPQDPKLSLEQLKLQAKQMQFKHEQWKLITTLQAARDKVAAEVRKLNAEVIKIMNDVNLANKELRLEHIKMAVEALSSQEEMMNERIGLLMSSAQEGEGNGTGSEDSESGGTPGLEGGPDDSGDMGGSPEVEGEPEGSMG